ncbi:hypothetical protein AB0910_00255 [Streptomyces sp. NPDC047002]|uniref:hypothetical protein n=1 Tax=Streptomyces sp. NPDC047002 TaxID=3155475 RepID=UPI0034549AC6
MDARGDTEGTYPTWQPGAARALRAAKLLTGCYLAVSALTLLAVALLRHDSAAVDDAVWARGTVVLVSSLVTFLCAVRAARGERGAYRRLRLLSAVMVVAIVVIIALPGTFPLWMKIEQGLCGALLIGVLLASGGRRVRASFAPRS